MKKFLFSTILSVFLITSSIAGDYTQNQKAGTSGSGASVSDTAYNADDWNGVTDVAPSKNAVRDKIEALDTAKANALGADDNYVTDVEKAALHAAGGDTALGVLGTKDTPIDADKVVQRNSASSDGLVTSTWTQIKTFLKTYFDSLYQPSSVRLSTLSNIAVGAANTVHGVNDAGVEGFYGNHIHDNSAAQIKDVVDPTKLWKISPANNTTGKTSTFITAFSDNKNLIFPDPTTNDNVAYGSAPIRMNTGAATARVKTVRDADDTIIELGTTLGTGFTGTTIPDNSTTQAALQALETSVELKALNLLTGFSASAGTVAGTDTVLQAFNKVVGNIALLPNETTTSIGALINGADAKTTPVDADYFGLMDSEATNILKKLSWAYVKSLLWASPQITGLPTLSNGATSAGYMDFKEDSDNGTNRARLIGPASTADVEITLPAATGTVALVGTEKIASFAWDGGGSAVATANSKRCMICPFAATVTGYNMVVDQDPGAGTTILNLDKDAMGDGTALATTDMDGAAHAYPPTVPDNKVSVNDTTITGWTTAVSAGDMICATVATNAVATWISLSIYGTR